MPYHWSDFLQSTLICITVYDDSTNDYVMNWSEERRIIIIIQENIAWTLKCTDLLNYLSFTNCFEF